MTYAAGVHGPSSKQFFSHKRIYRFPALRYGFAVKNVDYRFWQLSCHCALKYDTFCNCLQIFDAKFHFYLVLLVSDLVVF